MDAVIELTKGNVSEVDMTQVKALAALAKQKGWTVTVRTYGVE